MYDFETVINRNGTGAIKWKIAPQNIRDAGYIPLSVADMEFSIAPAIKEAIHSAVDHGICGYTAADDTYFDALKGFQMRRHGFEPKKEWLSVTGGVVTALGIAVRAYSEKGQGVIVQTPVYPPFFSAIKNNDRIIVENPLLRDDKGQYAIDFEGLEKLASRDDVKLMFLSSPHNPVGRVWSREELESIGKICKRNGVIVIADEIHQDIIMKGHKHTCFASIDNMADNCVICTAVSKTFNLAGLSCSNIFIPNEELHKRFRTVHERESTTSVPFYARAASIAAFSECDDWIDEMLTAVESNFNMMNEFISTNLGELKCSPLEGTYLPWVDMRALKLDDTALENLVVEKGGLALDEGYIFGKQGSGFERWNIALPKSELKKALLRLKKAIRG